MDIRPDLTLETHVTGGVTLKLQTAAWELNVRASRSELLMLRSIRDANWESRRSIRAGRSAGASVFWSLDDAQVSILVGSDDETWDIALAVPIETVDEILHAVDTKG